jgi:hypothetical protein
MGDPPASASQILGFQVGDMIPGLIGIIITLILEEIEVQRI